MHKFSLKNSSDSRAIMESTGIFLCFCIFFVAISAEICDKSNCPGPAKHYKDLKCTPVYHSPEDCCPYKYNCDHLYNKSPNKCHINGHEYEIGEKLRDEDKNPCDLGCFCTDRRGNIARFTCAQVDCFWPNYPQPNCYRRKNATQCCPGDLICPEEGKEEEIPTCEVDGKIYKDGDYFVPSSEPQKSCYCGPGYSGINEPPFCVTNKHECGTELRHAREIQNNCAPVYNTPEAVKTRCAVSYRCQNDRDQVIKKNPTNEPDSDMTCKFGDLVMNYGDELNQATDYSSVCVKCVCEVGPVPTCFRLSDNECDITKHSSFDKN